MASISSAQSSFISSGRISDFGSDEEFVPRESQSALIKLAAFLVEQAQQNLNESGQISSGALSDSITASEPIMQGGGLYIDVSALDYYDYINKGVRGVKGGASAGNYAFKNVFPSEAMVSAIDAWMKRGGMITKNTNAAKTVSKHEKKGAAISALDGAYAVARSIKTKGIKGSGYFDKAVKVAQAYSLEILGQALAVDVINSLPKKLNNGNSN